MAVTVFARLILGLGLAVPARADAYCAYKGVMYAKTTVSQEYGDAKWVAKVRVLSGQYHWSDVEDSWAVYRLEVIESYKGKPPSIVRFFTYRNSGGFYFDRKGLIPSEADVGSEYLLFFNPNPRSAGEPSIVKGTVWVNYPCGQSKRWSEVTQKDRAALTALKAGSGR